MSYLVCATPRTGSSLLIGLLDRTGVCGHPQAYFREPDEALWAERWQLPPGWGRSDFVQAAVRHGSTPNGVFGAKVMWGAQGWIDEVPGEKRFVHLYRRGVVAQAVSWARAEQTGKWLEGGNGEISGGQATGREPVFDAARIGELVAMIEAHEAGWRAWFAERGIEPLTLSYEELAADVGGSVRRIGQMLGVDVGEIPAPAHRRQADRLNDEWIARFQAASIAGS